MDSSDSVIIVTSSVINPWFVHSPPSMNLPCTPLPHYANHKGFCVQTTSSNMWPQQ